LRQAFRRWGRPHTLRVDNGGPWGASGDLPPVLALWLLGLGIEVWANDPRCPEQNGVVERSQGTAKRWAEPGRCQTPEQLQQVLEQMDDIQRAEYPSVAGRSRQEAYPGLQHSGRRYSASWERRHWDLGRVLNQLALVSVTRRVDRSGRVSLYQRAYYVGVLHQGRDISVLLDPERREWLFVDDRGQQVRVQPAVDLTREKIIGLAAARSRRPNEKSQGPGPR
jgi:hypothetical protein